MPVKDKPIGPLFARLGIIRLGDPKKKNQPGAATPYFQLRDAPELIQLLNTDEPTELNVMWPFNDVDHNVDDYYRLYAAGSIICRGDGEIMDLCLKGAHFVVSGGTCTKSFSENGEDFVPGDVVPCHGPGEGALYPKCAECQIVSYPKVMIIEAMEAGYFGYYQIGSGSTSLHGRANIRGVLESTGEFVRFLTGRPHLAGIPMILSLKVQKISTPITDKDTGQGKRARFDKPILHLVPHPDWVQAQTSVMLQQAYQPLIRLPAPPAQLQAPTEQPAPEHAEQPSPAPAEPFEEGEFRDAQRELPTLDASGIETPGQCWDRVFEDLGLYKSKAVEIAGLTDEQLATLHPADIYAKVWMAQQAQDTRPKEQQPPTIKQRKAASPATLKAELQAASKKLRHVTDGQRGLVVKLLNEALGGDEARHSVLFWIWGKESQGDLADSQIAATWDRLKPDKVDGVWLADPVAIAEFQAIHKQALLDAGQLEMELAEPEAQTDQDKEIPW